MNELIITKDFASIKAKLEQKYDNIRFFISQKPPYDFILGEKKNETNPCNARTVLNEAYISESSLKVLVIMANSFRIEAQNYLLKSFEEPPKNIKFIIISPALNLLLATVKSRFIVKRLQKSEKIREYIAVDKIDLRFIYEELKAKEYMDKESLSDYISSLACNASLQKKLSEDDLELFFKASELAKLNARSYTCLLALLLTIYERV